MIKVSGIDSHTDRITQAEPHEWEVDIYVPAFMRTPRKVGRIYHWQEDGETGYEAVVEVAGVDGEVPARGDQSNGLGFKDREDARQAIAEQAIRILIADGFGEL